MLKNEFEHFWDLKARWAADRFNTLIQFYSFSLSAYESMVQKGPEPEPINLEP
jgi:hypothetical protein